jgi:hypothetical protein
MRSLHDLLQDLQTQVTDLQDKVEQLEKEILEKGLAFEINKNNLDDEVTQSLRGFDPNGINLAYPSDLSIKITDKKITGILNSIFKVEL